MWHTGRRPIVTAIVRLAVILAALACANPVHAQGAGDYPSRQAKVLLPFAPGGVVDVMGRLLAQRLSDSLGQTFYVENHGGGGGNIGAAMVQAAAPDGYTVLITSSSFLINPGLQKVPYDPIGGFAPITIPSASPSVLVVNPAEPVSTVKELIELIRKEPGKHSYASAGVGSTPHLQGEMFKLAYGLDMVHVPFAGGGPALQSAVAGHTPIAFTALPPAIPLIKAGSLRALAVIGPSRASALPDVPTMTEAGLPGQETETVLLALAPAGTPKEIVSRLNREIVKIIAMPEVRQRFDTLGFAPVGTTPEETSARIKVELNLWAKVIRDAKIAAQ
jgi:tripartite-type tricarboxylate transporter receptor subunit TctC